MAGWTILVYMIFTALLSPLLVSLLDWGVFRGDRLMVGNEELISWLLSPSGIIYFFLFLMIILTSLVVRYAGLFQIVTDQITGKQVSVGNTALHIAPRLHILMKLCALTIIGAIVLLIPLVAGLGIIYAIYLAEFDINYYWLTTPPEWNRALTIGGIWLAIWGISTLITIGCIMPALPAYLEGRKSLREALQEVWVLPLHQTIRFIKVIALATAGWMLIRVAADASVAYLFLVLIEAAGLYSESLRALLLIAGGYFFITLTLGTIISFFGFSLISTIITKFYYTFTKPHISLQAPGFLHLTQKTIRVLTWWTKPARASVLIVLLLTGSVITSFIISSDHYREYEITVVSHRANAPPAPENSLAALENSIALGVDYAEIDVQLTADETVVILHDEDLMRVAGVPGRIANMRYEDINELTLFTDQALPDSLIRIPTLAGFIESSKERIKLMIELKYYGFNQRLAEETVRLIREYGMENRVVVKSNNIQAVRQMRSLAPDISMGYVFAVGVGDISRLQIDFLSVNQQYLNADLMRRAEQQNLKVFTWTVNQRENIISAIQNGVDGIITDYPERVLSIIQEINELTLAERLLLQLGLLILEAPSEQEVVDTELQ